MLAFVAVVIAVVALVIASNARREARELRELVVGSRLPVVREAPPRREVPDDRPPIADNIPPAEPPPPPGPPPPPPPLPTPTPVTPPRTWNVDWENLVGIKLFSWIAGIALVLAAVFLFKYSVEHGWLRPAIRAAFGLITGITLLVVCELRIARNYKFTANAMLGAGIAILYATLFALHGRWHLWPAPAAFFGMLLVTAAAVYLSTRRDSVFIALLGLLGGFATPALLSSGENRPIALFSYLLLLNGGLAWIAFRKRWPLLTGLSVVLTAIYQWAWVERFLTTGQLPLAAAIFLVFAAVGASSLWPRDGGDRSKAFRTIAAAGAVLPLLFAFFTAVVPEYGARFNVLFGFLLLVAAGLAAISLWRGAAWLNSLGGAATLLTFFIWLTVSYTPQSWPWSVAWLGVFVALYLATGVRLDTVATYTAPLLFFVFTGLSLHEPQRYGTLTGAMFALLAIVFVFALLRSKPYVAAIALALSSLAVMTMDDAPAGLTITAQVAIFAALFVIAWIHEQHWLAITALPFFIAATLVHDTNREQVAAAAVLYALFLAYPASLGSRVRNAIAPHLAACLASGWFFTIAYAQRSSFFYGGFVGVIPALQALLLIALLAQLLRYEPFPPRLGMIATVALLFLTITPLVELDREWMVIAWAIEAAALAWLWSRVPNSGIAVWSAAIGGLLLAVLLAEPKFDGYAITYTICAGAMFVAAYLAPPIRIVTASLGTIHLFVLLNVAIRDFYDHRTASSLASDLTYTIAWALFAIAMLVAGIILGSRGARVAALGLLVVTVLKCFLHDLANLGGLYRVASLFGLAVSLVLVGLMLQKFVMMRRVTSD